MAAKRAPSTKTKTAKEVRPWKTDIDFLHDVCKQNQVFDYLDKLDEWIVNQKRVGSLVNRFLVGCFMGIFTIALLRYLEVI